MTTGYTNTTELELDYLMDEIGLYCDVNEINTDALLSQCLGIFTPEEFISQISENDLLDSPFRDIDNIGVFGINKARKEIDQFKVDIENALEGRPINVDTYKDVNRKSIKWLRGHKLSLIGTCNSMIESIEADVTQHPQSKFVISSMLRSRVDDKFLMVMCVPPNFLDDMKKATNGEVVHVLNFLAGGIDIDNYDNDEPPANIVLIYGIPTSLYDMAIQCDYVD